MILTAAREKGRKEKYRKSDSKVPNRKNEVGKGGRKGGEFSNVGLTAFTFRRARVFLGGERIQGVTATE